ncbi:wax ester/triacylglycerol synthase domain-containing protein [Kribbella sp. NPDC050820]|uniref:wax ester/triacylglycerol synthase domain-containing protein n=1 Tax=Kribbella sp. NPDC050820 TaxID=3155408 RepID=UPI003401C7EB
MPDSRPRDRLRPQDRFFLDQEAPGSTMNVGALVTVEGTNHDAFLIDLTKLFASKIHLLPRLRQRLATVPLAGASAVWVDDAAFDLSARIRMAPLHQVPNGAALLAFAGAIVSEPLDRSGPLWDVAVIPRTGNGQSAVVLRWHHALIDGMSGIEIGKLLLSADRTYAPPPPEPWTPDPAPDDNALVAETLALQAVDTFRTAAQRTARWADRDEDRISTGALLQGLGTFAELGTAPPNPFRPARPGARRYAAAAIPEADLQGIRRRFDVSLEAVILSIVAGATSRLLLARGTELDTLRVFIPRTVAFRSRSAELGNHATFNVVDLPVGPVPEANRLHDIAQSLERVRHSHQAEAVTAIADLIASGPSLPGPVNQTLARWFGAQNLVHAVVSYMRGPRRPLYLAGRAHLGTCPILPRSNGVGLLFGVVSLGGTTNFGLVADPLAVPDLEFLAAALRHVGRELRS